jgi:hypothetical protein
MTEGITSSLYQSQAVNQFQQMRSAFQQLGTDLQSGDVAAARKEFESLTRPSSNSTTTESQQIQQLGQDLQFGNLSAAQQDYIAIQRTMQQHAHGAHGHHHSGSGADQVTPTTGSDSSTDPLNLLTNLATTAACAYGGGALTGGLTAGSMLSAIL